MNPKKDLCNKADADKERRAIRRRLERFLKERRVSERGVVPPEPEDPEDVLRWETDLMQVRFELEVQDRIDRRVIRLAERRDAAAGLAHLKRDERRALEVLRNGVSLIRIRTEDQADEIAAGIHADMPWEAVPYKIHTILADNGSQFAEQPRNRNSVTFRKIRFDMICEANGIENRLTKPNHPWTNGQVERMNRTIKDATVKRYHYYSHDQLRSHLADFLVAYNFARRLKTLSGHTPYEYVCKIWRKEPDRFILNPIHQMPGLNT